MRPQFLICDQYINPRILQDEIHLGRFQEIINRHYDCGSLENPEKSWHKLRTILQPQTHSLAWLHTKLRLQPVRNENGFLPKFCIRILLSPPEKGNFL